MKFDGTYLVCAYDRSMVGKAGEGSVASLGLGRTGTHAAFGNDSRSRYFMKIIQNMTE